jgi:DNA-binding response OmpR family regulator
MGADLPTDTEVIVILTPEKAAVQELHRGLEQAGYRTVVVKSLEELRVELGSTPPALVLVNRTHFTLESIKRNWVQSKTLFVTFWLMEGVCTIEQYVHDLEAGADDVVSRQTPRLIVAKVRALLRRERLQRATQQVLSAGPLRMDLDKHEVTVNGRVIALAPKEFSILQCFLRAPGRAFSREEMLDRVWGKSQALEEHALDVHIHALRRKIEGTTGHPKLIVTVRKFGYKLNL